jgi:cell division protein FtsN
MKKLAVLGMGVCIALAFSSCKSSESAYKKAYEKAKQQELAEPQTTAPAEEVAPVVTGMRQEKVTVVSGGTSLKTFSVVCGAYSVKANAEGVKQALVNEGYTAMVVYNAERNLYRVVIGTFDDRASAENLRDSFKAKHPSNDDFQKAWLLYSVN